MTRDTTPRRSRGGGYVIPADALRAGDRLELTGAGQPVFFPIIEINDTPKMRRVTINVGSLAWPQRQDVRMRKTTLVARGVRHGEAPPA